MSYVNYRIADGTVINHGGQEGAGEHATEELAKKRLTYYLRSPWKGSITRKDTATAEKSVWWAYKQAKNKELGKPSDAHY